MIVTALDSNSSVPLKRRKIMYVKLRILLAGGFPAPQVIFLVARLMVRQLTCGTLYSFLVLVKAKEVW